MEAKELVKGLSGNWHITDGSFDSSHNKLNTLCGTSISPNNRKFKVDKYLLNCPSCIRLYNS